MFIPTFSFYIVKQSLIIQMTEKATEIGVKFKINLITGWRVAWMVYEDWSEIGAPTITCRMNGCSGCRYEFKYRIIKLNKIFNSPVPNLRVFSCKETPNKFSSNKYNYNRDWPGEKIVPNTFTQEMMNWDWYRMLTNHTHGRDKGKRSSKVIISISYRVTKLGSKTTRKYLVNNIACYCDLRLIL